MSRIMWILLFFNCCGLRRAAQSYCSKIDFNQATVSGFRECSGQFAPMFKIKEYVSSEWPQPFRPSSKYYLSVDVEGYSCAESSTVFHLNATSEIDVAIYLDFQYRGAFIEVLVIDTDAKKTINRWKNETSAGWFLLSKKMGVTVRNAQVRNIALCQAHRRFEMYLIFFPDRISYQFKQEQPIGHRVHLRVEHGNKLAQMFTQSNRTHRAPRRNQPQRYDTIINDVCHRWDDNSATIIRTNEWWRNMDNNCHCDWCLFTHIITASHYFRCNQKQTAKTARSRTKITSTFDRHQ